MSAKGHYFLLLSGRLKAHVAEDGFIIWKFVEDAPEGQEGESHLVRSGDLLKIIDEENTLVWSGVVAFNYEMMSHPDPDKPGESIQHIAGKKVRGIQGSARPAQWLQWFEQGYRAKLEIRINEMPTHYGEAGGEEVNRGAERDRMIGELLGEHDKRDAAPKEKLPTAGKKWWED